MAIVKTPQDIGAAIRAQRKQFGWNQDALAKAIGVSRQWVIDIEKGKARAELALVLRALQALGLSLDVQLPKAAPEDVVAVAKAAFSAPRTRPDINEVVERATHTAAPLIQSDALKSINQTARSIEHARQADLSRYVSAASQLSELAKQADPSRYLSAVTRLSDLLESTSAVAGKTDGSLMRQPKRRQGEGKATKKVPAATRGKKR